MATINPAKHFRLDRKGAILPGYDADMVVIDDFEHFTVEKVFKRGMLVAENSEMVSRIRSARRITAKETVRMRTLKKDDIRLRAKTTRARVIELIPDQIETRQVVMPVSTRDGYVVSDPDRDVLKLLVIERHRASEAIGLVRVT